MAKYKQECIFGIRAVIEAIQQEKEIDKVMLSFSMDSDSSFQIILFCGKRTLRKTGIENRPFPFGVCFLLKTAFPRQ